MRDHTATTTILGGLAALLLGTPARAQAPVPAMFATAASCMACHNGLQSARGEDVSVGAAWRPGMMANAARDAYWQASVRRELADHPTAAAAIENECAACHMPMAAQQARAEGRLAQVFAHLPAATAATPEALLSVDGVSCVACHQLQAEGLGAPESFNGRFRVDPQAAAGARPVYGPFAIDPGRTRLMRSAAQFEPRQGAHVQRSELCASCHTLVTHSLGPGGVETGRLPEQMPFVEWQHSDFAEAQSCQDCHMPTVDGEVPFASVLGLPRAPWLEHDVRGANFLMPMVHALRAAELGVAALPLELEATARRAREFLVASSAALAVQGAQVEGALELDVEVSNLAGHKLPTAYPSRRAWLHLTVRDAGGATLFESGALLPSGAIAGNDNDEDAGRYEPHHLRIERPEQVQIYEPILGDPAGQVTTGLLAATQYLKDNRLLPSGMDKATAPDDIRARGAAVDDADFTGGSDRVRYVVATGSSSGPYKVEVELWYQPIGYRWARNLEPQATVEAVRFVQAYEQLAPRSAQRLAVAQATVP